MAPEQLRWFEGIGEETRPEESIDGRTDIYALGIILFELLTGRSPFDVTTNPQAMCDERMYRSANKHQQALRDLKPFVTPAIRAIIVRCLEADPARRYPSAEALAEDLERQLAHLPLKHTREPSWRERFSKWVVRNPRLASPTSVMAGVAALVLVGCAVVMWYQKRREVAELERHHQVALQEFDTGHEAFQQAIITLSASLENPSEREQGIQQARAALGRYHVLTQPNWRESPLVQFLGKQQRERLEQDVGLVLFLLARAEQRDVSTSASTTAPTDSSAWLLALAEAHLSQQAPTAVRQALSASPSPTTVDLASLSAMDLFLLAAVDGSEGRYQSALERLREVTQREPEHFAAWFVQGMCLAGRGQFAEAASAFSTCIALQPRFSRAYFNRGLAYLKLRDFRGAHADFDRVLKLEPRWAEAYVQRSLARQGMRRYAEALEDLSAALELPGAPAKIYFMRSQLKQRLGDSKGAQSDLAEGIRNQPNDEASWIERGLALASEEPQAALEAFQRAEQFNPRSLPALQNQAHILSERLGKTKEAIGKLDRLLEMYPEFTLARCGRAVLLARTGAVDQALTEAKDCVKRDPHPSIAYQAAGVLALCSIQKPDCAREAIRLLASALGRGYGAALLEHDSDLNPIRQNKDFLQLEKAILQIQAAAR